MASLLLKNAVPFDRDYACDILIENGFITRMEPADRETFTADNMLDCGGLTAFPGLFDMHVHFRDPGYTYKEDVFSGSEAALAGGVTGVVCMPNTNPVTDNAQVVRYIVDKAKETGVKIYPAACITSGMKGGELTNFDELRDAGVKVISDDGRPVKNAEIMRQALEQSGKYGLLCASHCEDLDIINGGIINKGEVSKALGVKGMDRASEDSITAREIMLAASCGARIHICHVSTKGSIEMIRAAKQMGVAVTCETCPHYFMYTDEKVMSRDADYRMNPPLRTESDRNAVLAAVLDGTIDCIVTDHAPHAAEEKSDFEKAPNGVVGLETSLAAALTVLHHENGMPLRRIAELMSSNPRKLLGIEQIAIIPGSRADICIADIDRSWTVVPEKLHSKSKNTVFKGETFKGRVIYTITDGEVRYTCEE